MRSATCRWVYLVSRRAAVEQPPIFRQLLQLVRATRSSQATEPNDTRRQLPESNVTRRSSQAFAKPATENAPAGGPTQQSDCMARVARSFPERDRELLVQRNQRFAKVSLSRPRCSWTYCPARLAVRHTALARWRIATFVRQCMWWAAEKKGSTVRKRNSSPTNGGLYQNKQKGVKLLSLCKLKYFRGEVITPKS